MPSSSAIAPVSGAQDRPPLHGVAGLEAVTTTSGDLDDAFFRQMVSSMRNGVLAITFPKAEATVAGRVLVTRSGQARGVTLGHRGTRGGDDDDPTPDDGSSATTVIA